MRHKTFRKTQLATSLSLILGASALTPAFAEEAATEQPVEVIEVTGVRGSLIKSMDIKRESSGIVDAINAEDIGKFPDSNLAESLQRITGVSIDRSNGEGSKVSVRGFSANRNLVTLNGRQMPNTTGDRSFDFANIAAEGISGVEVYKTAVASQPTGGIGATLNVTTNKPLSNPGMHSVISAQALHDTSTDSGTTPELSGLYSNTFADDTFGVSLSASYSERDNGNQQAGTQEGWFQNAAGQGYLANDRSPQQINLSNNHEVYSMPQRGRYRFEEVQRERTNAQLTLQYSPIEDLTTTLDYTYIKREVSTQFNQIAAWYSQQNAAEDVWTGDRIASPLLHHELYPTLSDVSFGSGDFATKDETTSLGFNVEWQATDSLKVSYDYHDSDAENTPNHALGSNNILESAAFRRIEAATDFTGDLPTLSVTTDRPILATDLVTTGSIFTNNMNEAHVEQHQFSSEYVFDEAGSIDFGIAVTTSENRSRSRGVQRNNWGGERQADNPDTEIDESQVGIYNTDNFTANTIQDQFDDVSGGNFSSFEDLLAPGDAARLQANILDSYFEFNFAEVAAVSASKLAVQAGIVGDCGNSFCPSTDYAAGSDQYTNEEMTAVYFQYNYDGEIADMPFDLHLGVRYEETEIETSSAVTGYNKSRWEGATELALELSGERELGTQVAEYDHTLPSINFNLEVTDDIILRAAYSQTIGRPSYGNMIGGTSVGGSGRVNNEFGGNSGDAGLLPLESDNIDFSAEWYYGEGSYVSLGYFQKDITNEEVNVITPYTEGDLFNPGDVNSPWVLEAIAATAGDETPILADDLGGIRNWIAINKIDDPAVNIVNGQIQINGRSVDPLIQFEISSTGNSPLETGFDGLEFAVQHIFGETGFGGIFNYTKVDSDHEFDLNVLTPQIAETGISDTANLVGFYEKDGLSVRIAYNWRDEYLAATSQGTGDFSPQYIEAYDQVDLTVSYDIPQVEGLNIFFNGINITDEYTRSRARSSYEVLNVTQTGARWALGARYSF